MVHGTCTLPSFKFEGLVVMIVFSMKHAAQKCTHIDYYFNLKINILSFIFDPYF